MIETSPEVLRPEVAKRCPDFDEDCAAVRDHAKCAAGAVVVWYGTLAVLPPIEGFCPYVCGMMK